MDNEAVGEPLLENLLRRSSGENNENNSASSEPPKRKRKLIDTTLNRQKTFDNNLAKSFDIADLVNDPKRGRNDSENKIAAEVLNVKSEKQDPAEIQETANKSSSNDTYNQLTALFGQKNNNPKSSSNSISTQNPSLLTALSKASGICCKVCKLNFSDFKTLKKHIATPEHIQKMAGKIPNTCKKCKIVFQSKSLLKIHNEFVHRIITASNGSPIYDKTGISRGKYEKKEYYTPCVFCSAKYKSLKCLQSHMEKCKKRPKDVPVPTVPKSPKKSKKNKNNNNGVMQATQFSMQNSSRINTAITNATNLALLQGPPINSNNSVVFQQMQERIASLESENLLLKTELSKKNSNNKIAQENVQLKSQLQQALRKIQKTEVQKQKIRDTLKHVKL